MLRTLCILAVVLTAPSWAAEPIYSVSFGNSGLGGTTITALAVDPQGNAYVAGTTTAPEFPATPGAFQTHLKNPGVFCSGAFNPYLCDDAFVAKLDPTGNILWATFLGGTEMESLSGVAFDSAGNVYVAGITTSPDFPTTARDATPGPIVYGEATYYIAKLSPDGASLIYSFLFHANNLAALAVDTNGNAYVTGWANTDQVAATPGAFQSQPPPPAAPPSDALRPTSYVAKLNQAGSKWEYLTFLDGSGVDLATGIAVNANGEAYVTGATTSTDFPGAAAGAQKSLVGDTDAFVAKLNAAGSQLLWSSYAGSGGVGSANIALDGAGGVYLSVNSAPVAIYRLRTRNKITFPY